MSEVNWTTAGVWAGAIGLLGILIRQIGPWRAQITQTEERLRKELSEALTAERQANAATLANERAAHLQELRQHALERDEMGDRIAKLERESRLREKLREAERSIERHRFNNLDQCFNALLLLLKASPDRVPEAVAMIEEMRATQLLAEAEEKAILRATEISHIEDEARVGSE